MDRDYVHLSYAAKLLALALTDETIAPLRAAEVLRHWRDQVLEILKEQDTDSQRETE